MTTAHAARTDDERAERAAFRAGVRRFVEREIEPFAAAYAEDGSFRVIMDIGERLLLAAGATTFAGVSSRAWVEALVERHDRGEIGPERVAELCLLKNHATQAMQFCADQGVQILGGMGCVRGTKSERVYRR